MPIREKLTYLRQVVTVEPVVLSYVIIKAWRNILSYNHIFNKPVFFHHLSFEFFFIVSPILLIFFTGCSDKNCRRKPFLLLPVFGELLAVGGYSLCGVFLNRCPYQLGLLLALIPICFGSPFLLFTIALAYIADVSTPKTRTFRIGIMYVSMLLATFVLQKIHGWTNNTSYPYREFLWTWALASVFLCLFVILYVIFWIIEPRSSNTAPGLKILTDIVNPKHAKRTGGVLAKITLGENRFHFLVIVLATLTLSPTFFVEQVAVTNTIHNCECYSYLMELIPSLSIPILLYLFVRSLQMNDLVMLLVGCVLKSTSTLTTAIFGMSTIAAHLGIGTFADISTMLIEVSARAAATRMVSANDFGKMLALVEFANILSTEVVFTVTVKMGYVAIWKKIYYATAGYTICSGLALWILYRSKRIRDEEERNVNDEHEMAPI